MVKKIKLLTGAMVQRKHCQRPEVSTGRRWDSGRPRGGPCVGKAVLTPLEANLNPFPALNSVEDQGRATRTMQGLR